MKILELGKYYAPYRGGIETLVQTWSEGFARLGAEVDCVVANHQNADSEEQLRGVRVHRCARKGVIQSLPLCPRYLGSTRRHQADLWHGHIPNPLMDAACFLGNRKTPLVVSYHSNVVRQTAAGALYAPLLRWLLARASRIVVATRAQVEHSPCLQRHKGKVDIIPFGVDLARFAWNERRATRVAQLLRELEGKPAVLTAGRLVSYKGQRYLLEACRNLDVVLWIIGSGPLENDLKLLADDLGMSGRTVFWGEVDDEKFVDLLSACAVFALPSITPAEAFGLVQAEAMACGKPVVNTKLQSGVPWVSPDGATGLTVPPADAAALASALSKLLANDELRHAFGEAARRRAQAEFCQETMIRRYWECFQRLVPRGLAGA